MAQLSKGQGPKWPSGEAVTAGGDNVQLAGRLDAFISYARRPGVTEFVDFLEASLAARGKVVWVDRKSIEAAAEWRARVEKGIKAASALIFVISPESVASEECRHELELAVAWHKRVIPVLYRDTDPGAVPEALRAHNWVLFRDQDDPGQALGQVVDALEADLEWRDSHTRLAQRAEEWAASNGDASFLLRGTDLRRAEQWYAGRGTHKEQPTRRQLEYIAESRAAASKRQRRLFAGVAVALGVSVALTVIAVISRQEAVANEKRAIAEALRAQSVAMAAEASSSLSSGDIALGDLLAVEAQRRASTHEAFDALAGAAALPFSFAAQVGSDVHALAWSPDGQALAAGDQAGDVLLFSLRSATTRTLHLGSPIDALAFRPGGKVLAVGDQAGEVALYDLDGARLDRLQAEGQVLSLAFSSNGEALAVAEASDRVGVYEVSTRRWLPAAIVEPSAVWALAFRGDGSLATGQLNGQVRIYDPHTGRVTALQARGAVLSLAYSPDGKTLAVGTASGQIEAYSGGRLLTRGDDGSVIWALAFSPDGKVIALGDQAGRVTLYSLTSRLSLTLAASSPVYALSFSPDGRGLAIGDSAGSVLVYDLSRVPRSAGGIAYSVAFGPDAVAVGSSSGEVAVYPLRGGVAKVLKTKGTVKSVAFDASGSLLAAGVGSQVKLFDLQVPKVRTLLAPGTVLSVAFGPRAGPLAVGTEGGTVSLYNLATSRAKDLKAGGPVLGLSFSPDGKSLAASDGAGLKLWNLATGKTRVLGEASEVLAVAFSPDGRLLATGDEAGVLRVHNLTTGRTTVFDEGSPVFSVAFAPGSRVLATGDEAGLVKVYRLAAGSAVSFNEGGTVFSVAFSTDGKLLAAADDAGQVAMLPEWAWASGPARLEDRLCAELAGASMTREQWAAYVPGQPYRPTCPPK